MLSQVEFGRPAGAGCTGWPTYQTPVAHLTNNKDVFLCILRFHTRVGFLRHYERLLSELEGFPDTPGDKYTADSQGLCDRNFNVACETGIRYPSLPAMLNRDAMLIRISVRSILRVIPCYPGLSHVFNGIS